MFWNRLDEKGKSIWLPFNSKNETLQDILNEIGNEYNSLHIRKKDVTYTQLDFYNFSNNSRFGINGKVFVIAIPYKEEERKHKRKCDQNIDRTSKFYFLVLVGGKEKAAVFHLDGTSTPIHDANKLIHLVENKEVRNRAVNLDKSLKYLDFFTSFVAGDEGPFIDIQSVDRDICDCHSSSVELFSYYEKDIKLKQFDGDHQTYLEGLPRKFKAIKKHISDFHEVFNKHKDDVTLWSEFVDSLPKKKDDTTADNEIVDWEAFTSQHKKSRKKKNPWSKFFLEAMPHLLDRLLEVIGKFYKVDEESTEIKFTKTISLVQYSQAIFISLYRIPENGIVDMIDDLPYDGRSKKHHALPIGRWTFERAAKMTNLKILKFTGFSEDVFERKLEEASIPLPLPIEGNDGRDNEIFLQTPITAKNGYQGTLTRKWIEQHLYHSLEVESISFRERLDLKGIEVDGHLTFKDCQFLRPIFLSQATIRGSLIFENCTFYGIPSNEESDLKYENIALGLENIHIMGELKILNSDSFGSVDLRRGKIELSTSIRGLEVFPHFNEYQLREQLKKEGDSDEKVQIDHRFKKSGVTLDLRYSQFKRGLDLSANFAYDSKNTKVQFQKNKRNESDELKRSFPNKIAGHLTADNSLIDGPLFLSGLILARPNNDIFESVISYYMVSFNNCIINGDVLMWRPIETAGTTNKYMRTYIERDLEFQNVNVRGKIDLRSIWIGGSLLIENAICRGNINLECLPQFILDHTDTTIPYKISSIRKKPIYKFPTELQIQVKNDLFLAVFGRTNIGNNLSLKGANVDGVVYMHGLFVNNKVLLENGRYGSIRFGAHVDQLLFSREVDKWDDTIDKLDEKNPCSSTFFPYREETPHWLRYIANTHPDCHFTKEMVNEFTVDHSVKKFYRPYYKKTKAEGRFEKARAGFKGLLITKSKFDYLSIRNSIIDGNASLSHSLVIGSRFKDYSKTFYDDINKLSRNIIPQTDLDRNIIEIENVTINGKLSFYDEDFAQRELESINDRLHIRNRYAGIFPQHFKNGVNLEKLGVEIEKCFNRSSMKNATILHGSLSIKNITVDDELNLAHLKVGGKTEIVDIIAKSSIQTNNHSQYSYFISNSILIDLMRSEGNMTLSGIETNHFETKNTTIGGHLQLSNIKIKGKGDFILQNSAIQGQLDFKGSLEIKGGNLNLMDLDVYGNISTDSVSEENAESIKLKANQVNLELLRLQGSFILPKLDIEKKFEIYNSRIEGDFDFIEFGNDGRIGESLSILMTTIKGFLKLAELERDIKTPNEFKSKLIKIGQISGNPIDLSSSSFGKANIPIRKDESGDVQEGKWILQHAQFEHLNVIDTSVWDKNKYLRNNNKLTTSEIDFRGSKIERLSFNEKEGQGNGDNDEIKHIKAFLNMGNRGFDDFSLEGYANVEKHLRNQGRKQDANKIYASMQRRWRDIYLVAPLKSISSLLNPFKILSNLSAAVQWFFNISFFDLLTSFGSNWLRPLFFIVCLFFVSYVQFSRNEENWSAYTLDPVSKEYVLYEPGVKEIGFFGTLKSLEITTPTISLITNYTFKETKYVFKQDNNRWLIFMKALGWLFWPAFLLSVSGILKRN